MTYPVCEAMRKAVLGRLNIPKMLPKLRISALDALAESFPAVCLQRHHRCSEPLKTL